MVITTECARPDVDDRLVLLIVDEVRRGLSYRDATEAAAHRAAEEAAARGWRTDLVQFVVIRTVDLGARLSAAADRSSRSNA
jgi:hypothetical protein